MTAADLPALAVLAVITALGLWLLSGYWWRW